MNKQNLSYDVIIKNKDILNEIQIYFDNGSKDSSLIKGGHFFFISKKLGDTFSINFFDFCEQLSNDIDYLKRIALLRSNESDYFFGEKDIDIKEEYDKEKERLSKIHLFQERDNEKATILVDSYFKIFNTDRISKNNWNDFIKYFDLNKITPTTENVIKVNNDITVHNGEKNYLDLLKNDSISIDLKEYRKKLENNELKAQNTFKCSNSKEIFAVVINSIFAVHPTAVIKKCKNCGKLFIPSKSDTLCCTRNSPQYEDKNCREAYAIISKLEKQKKDPCRKLYKKIYDRMYKSIEYSTTDSKDKEMLLERFKEKGNYYRDQITQGLMNNDDYLKWLTTVDETGVISDD